MAKLAYSRTFYIFNMTAWSADFKASYSSTQARTGSGSSVMTLEGTDFTFTSGIPVGGTVTSLDYRDASGKAFSITRCSYDLSMLHSAMEFGDDTYLGSFLFSGSDTIEGSDSEDFLIGLGGADSLYGFDGNDLLSGGAGADVLGGGAGNDTLAGGDGSDLLSGSDGNDRFVIEADTGDNETVKDTSGTDVLVWRLTGDETTIDIGRTRYTDYYDFVLRAVQPGGVTQVVTIQEQVSLSVAGKATTAGIETLILQDDGSSQSFRVSADRFGSAAADLIVGTSLDNAIDGLAGTDLIYGRAGHDTLAGGAGADTMYGGPGEDVFTFKATSDFTAAGSSKLDTIKDFRWADGDCIDLSAIDANGGGNGTFRFFADAPTAAGSGSARLWYDDDASVLYGSTDADTAAEFAISVKLTGITMANAQYYILL